MKNKITSQVLGLLLVLGILLFVYFYMVDIILYFILAWIVSMMGGPVMKFLLTRLKLNKFKFGTMLSAVLVLFFFMILFSLFFMVILPPLISQVNVLTSIDYNKLFEPLQKPIEEIQQKLISYRIINADDISIEHVKQTVMNILSFQKISNVFSSLINFAGNFLVSFFSILFISFFMLRDSSMFSEIVVSFVPEKYTDQMHQALNEISSLLKRYFSGIAFETIILFVYVLIVLSILGIKDALIIAFFLSFLNIIPYIGPIIGYGLGALIVFTNQVGADFQSIVLPKMLIVIGVGMSMQALDNYIIQPSIYSDKIKAHPLEIFVVIMLGAKVYGIAGMVMAIPVYIILRAIAKVFFSHYTFIQKIANKN